MVTSGAALAPPATPPRKPERPSRLTPTNGSVSWMSTASARLTAQRRPTRSVGTRMLAHEGYLMQEEGYNHRCRFARYS
jgi:hypothetical protein